VQKAGDDFSVSTLLHFSGLREGTSKKNRRRQNVT